LKEGISIIGGFAGSENALSERSGNLTTTLSGDFLNNDGWTENGTLSDEAKPTLSENAYHVVAAVDLSVPVSLISLKITGGVAIKLETVEGNSTVHPVIDYNKGAGLAVYDSNVEIVNCVFERNIAAEEGGGIYVGSFSGNGSSLTFLNLGFGDSVFFQNHVALYSDTRLPWGGGGGIFLSDGSEARFANVIFTGNTAPNGGAVGMINASASFLNCGFWANAALAGPESQNLELYSWPENGFGGAISFFNGAESGTDKYLDIVSCFFAFNTASTNGYSGQNGEIAGWGGAIAFYDSGSLKIALSIFDQNFADEGCGAIVFGDYFEGPAPTLDLNFCTFHSNRAANWGGAVGLDWGPDMETAGTVANGKGNIFLNNSILENHSNDLGLYAGANASVGGFHLSQSLFSGNNTGVVNIGTGNQAITPGFDLFNDPNNPEGPDMEWNTGDDGFVIQSSARVGRDIVERPLPSDFADFDGDGDTAEELPLDSDGTPFGSGPFFYGAYPEP
jgi:hypothetical protein